MFHMSISKIVLKVSIQRNSKQGNQGDRPGGSVGDGQQSVREKCKTICTRQTYVLGNELAHVLHAQNWILVRWFAHTPGPSSRLKRPLNLMSWVFTPRYALTARNLISLFVYGIRLGYGASWSRARAINNMGMNFAQLSSTQPCSAFVTMTTVPNCFATRRISIPCCATVDPKKKVRRKEDSP